MKPDLQKNYFFFIADLVLCTINVLFYYNIYLFGTHKNERTILFTTISLDDTKPNINPKTNPNPNHNLKLTLLTYLLTNTNHIQLFYASFEHRPLIFSLAIYFIAHATTPLLPGLRSHQQRQLSIIRCLLSSTVSAHELKPCGPWSARWMPPRWA